MRRPSSTSDRGFVVQGRRVEREPGDQQRDREADARRAPPRRRPARSRRPAAAAQGRDGRRPSAPAIPASLPTTRPRTTPQVTGEPKRRRGPRHGGRPRRWRARRSARSRNWSTGAAPSAGARSATPPSGGSASPRRDSGGRCRKARNRDAACSTCSRSGGRAAIKRPAAIPAIVGCRPDSTAATQRTAPTTHTRGHAQTRSGRGRR